MTSPLAVYAQMLDDSERPCVARLANGTTYRPLVKRWTGRADAVDQRALRDLQGPVLDIGCGPGRHLHALAHRGVFGLGVDLSPVAVGLARGRGANAIVGSIFDELPQTGGWGSALLLDGNIGIGGCPERLLRRVRTLLRGGGQALIECVGPERRTEQTQLRLETEDSVSDWFDWAEVSSADADRFVVAAGLSVVARWDQDDRWFVVARRDDDA
jgi:SAM-dependent methyltransferase